MNPLRLFNIAFLLATVHYTAWPEPPSREPSSSSLKATFSVSSTLGSPEPWTGTLTYWDSSSGLYLSLETKNGRPFTFLYDGKRSFLKTSKSQARLEEGFNYMLPPLALYLLRPCAAFPSLFAAGESTARCKEPKEPARFPLQAPFSVYLLNPAGLSELVYLTSSLRQDSGSGTPLSTLTIGSETKSIATFTYSNPMNVNGYPLPNTIKVVSGLKDGDQAPYSTLHLLTHAGGSAIKEDFPSISSLVNDGLFVTYMGGGRSAGVVYEPRRGSFESQLETELRTAKKASDVKKVANGQTPWIPIVASACFALLAIAIILRNRLRPSPPRE